MRGPRAFVFLAILAVAVAACGGGGSGRAIPVTAPGGGGSQGAHRSGVSLKIVVPKTTQTVSGRTRRPAYVSASLASVVYAISQGSATTSLVSGSDYTNISASSPGCTSGTTGLTCSIVIPATIGGAGSYTLTLATYDAAQTATCVPGSSACSGNMLGLASLPVTITPGSSTPVAVTLGGIPAGLVGQALSNYATGGGDHSNNALTLFGPSPQVGQIELVDADGNVIVDPGAPVVTAQSSNASALTVAISTPSASGTYDITFTPVLSGHYVQAGTYPATLSIVPPNTSQTYTFTAQITLAHSGLFISTCSNPDDTNQAAIYGYLDGNLNGASPDLTIDSISCSDGYAPGVATDRFGRLFVADGALLYLFTVAPGTDPAPLATSGPTQGLSFPLAVTADAGGFVYVGDQSNGLVAFTAPTPGAGTFGPPIATLPNTDFADDFIGALAVDNAGNLYAGVQEDGDYEIFQMPAASNNSAGLGPSTVPQAFATFGPLSYAGGYGGLAVDVQPSPSTAPNLWFGAEGYPSYAGELWLYGPSAGSAPIQTVTSGLGLAVGGVAVDGNGLVYAAYAGPENVADVVTLQSPTYTAGTPIQAPATSIVNGAVGVAVMPAAGIIGNNTGGGSPSPLGTATPAASARKRP